MNSVQQTEIRVLVALFVISHEPDGGWLSRDRLAKDFASDLDPKLFRSIVSQFERKHLVELAIVEDSITARLNDAAYVEVLKQILDVLGADEFRVDWKRERVITDAKGDNVAFLGLPVGWLIMTLEPKKEPVTAPMVPIKMPIPAGIPIPSQAIAAPKVIEGPWTRAGVIVAVLALFATVVLAVIFH